MQIKVFGETEKTNIVYLKLIDEDNSIKLIAVNEKGKKLDRGVVVSLNKRTGELNLHPYVSKEIGLSLDDEGRIIVKTI